MALGRNAAPENEAFAPTIGGRRRWSTLVDFALCLTVVAVFIVNLMPLQFTGSPNGR